MKINLVMVQALLLAAILIVCPFNLSAEKPSQMAWVGSINSKTWVVTAITEPPGDKNSHFLIGDAFKIADIGAVKRFVPFPALHGRLNAQSLKKVPGEDAFIPLTLLMKEVNRNGRPQEKQQHFCGSIKFIKHDELGIEQEHVMQIKIIDEKNLDIVLQKFSEDNWDQCTSFSSHGGIVHAKS